jgi:hypothetical protein
MTIIEIRSFRNGWQVYECPGVQPVFLSQEQAIDYATCRACFRSGEIRVLDSTGSVDAMRPDLENTGSNWRPRIDSIKAKKWSG